MDAPGFPADPNPLLVLLIWLVPLTIAAVAAVVAVVVGRRRRLDALRRALSVAAVVAVVVPAYFLALPAHSRSGTQTPDGVVECPLSGAGGSVMPGDHASELYRFWAPCVTASRRDVGLSLGLYAVAAGAVGVAALKAPRRSSRA